MRLWTAVVLLLVPLAAAHEAALPAVSNLRLAPGNQRIDIAWDPVAAADVAGYAVFVYSEGRLVQTLNTTETQAGYAGAVNGRVYVVEVAARDAAGNLGPRAADAATPQLEADQTYLALGLGVVWVGLLGYAVLLARGSRLLETRLRRLEQERKRLREPE